MLQEKEPLPTCQPRNAALPDFPRLYRVHPRNKLSKAAKSTMPPSLSLRASRATWCSKSGELSCGAKGWDCAPHLPMGDKGGAQLSQLLPATDRATVHCIRYMPNLAASASWRHPHIKHEAKILSRLPRNHPVTGALGFRAATCLGGAGCQCSRLTFGQFEPLSTSGVHEWSAKTGALRQGYQRVGKQQNFLGHGASPALCKAGGARCVNTNPLINSRAAELARTCNFSQSGCRGREKASG